MKIKFSYKQFTQEFVNCYIRSHVNSKSTCGSYYEAKTYIVLSAIIARALNITLFADPELTNTLTSTHVSSFPIIIPQVANFDSYNISVHYFWAKYYRSDSYENRKNLPHFVQVDSVDFNFIYCQKPQAAQKSPWHFDIFLEPFNVWIWLFLILSVTFVGLITKYGLLGTISVLLTSGVSSSKTSNQIGLFHLWMLASIVLVVHYSGKISSILISPSADQTIDSIRSLKENNYTLQFSFFRSSEYTKIHAIVNSFDRLGNDYLPNEISILNELLSNVIVEYNNNTMYYKSLCDVKKKRAALMGWPNALYVALNVKFNLENITTDHNVRCYVGQKLIPVGQNYFVFLPPHNILPAKIFAKVIEAGFYRFWIDEMYAKLYAMKVQDRSRVKSRTTINLYDDVVIKNLEMEGKVLVIFLLWIVCIILCFASFLVEVIFRIIVPQ